MSDTATLTEVHVPTVYFIDDSATMREVIRIAFRRESINVITCNDAASALSQFGTSAPDVVITDVIMPDKDGYEVCQTIKQNPDLRKIPVILMSGVVNRTVAEKAIAAQADELIRKPFQPQDLITRVKNLLNPASESTPPQDSTSKEYSQESSAALSGIFAPPTPQPTAINPQQPMHPQAQVRKNISLSPVSVSATVQASQSISGTSPSASADLQKLKNEVRRLEMLVRKLQADLHAERQYVASLEEHLKTLQELD